MAKGPKISAQLIGKETLARNFAMWDLAVQGRVKELVNRRSLEVMNEAKKLTPVDMGRLRSSIRPQFYQNGLTAEVQTNVGYAAFVEFGTGPRGKQMNIFGGPLPPGYQHGNGGKMPPIDIILAWMRRKGIKAQGRGGKRATAADERALAFLIARNIGKFGLRARPFLYPAFEKVRPAFEADLQNVVKDTKV